MTVTSMTSAIYVCAECNQEYDQPGTCEVCLIKLTRQDEEVQDKEWSENEEETLPDLEDEEDEKDDALGLTTDEEDLMGLAEKEDVVDGEDFDDHDPADRYM